ncbi:hypothetical protein [Roseibium sp.]|uniref:hypothetical protein n=1 Tax=Roseibium sp. TaxID=1936156 RepID=UPI003264C8ED
MKRRDKIITAILLIALVSIVILIFSIPVSMSTKTYASIAFGAILAFGILELILSLISTLKNQNKR